MTTSTNSTIPVAASENQRSESFRILHGFPTGPVLALWRNFLSSSDFPTHYAAPEFFLEPILRKTKGFAVLSLSGERVTGILAGVRDGHHVRSGLSVRPQIAFLQHADRHRAMANLLGVSSRKRRPPSW